MRDVVNKSKINQPGGLLFWWSKHALFLYIYFTFNHMPGCCQKHTQWPRQNPSAVSVLHHQERLSWKQKTELDCIHGCINLLWPNCSCILLEDDDAEQRGWKRSKVESQPDRHNRGASHCFVFFSDSLVFLFCFILFCFVFLWKRESQNKKAEAVSVMVMLTPTSTVKQRSLINKLLCWKINTPAFVLI